VGSPRHRGPVNPEDSLAAAMTIDMRIPVEGGLYLSLPDDADVPAIVDACQDPEIQRFTRVPSPYRIDDARDFVKSCRVAVDAGSGLGLVVRDGSGCLLGSCGLVAIDWQDGRGKLGYWVAPWARRQGVAARATRAVCRWAFNVAGLERLELETVATNDGSNAVAAGLGFVHEGTLRAAAASREPAEGSARLDVNVWGLLPAELE
jgi:RimJ/RimL family protein N-acetyltransferase